MKQIGQMTQGELAAYIQSHLRKYSVEVVLSGGAAVAIHSRGKYVSLDLDLVNAYFAKFAHIKEIMHEIDFCQEGRHFKHSDSKFIVEFPPGPLSIGGEPVSDIEEIEFSTGILRIISSTDSVKDRLAAYYHWGDQQCLSQAILIAEENDIDLEEVRRWSEVEGQLTKFLDIRRMFESR